MKIKSIKALFCLAVAASIGLASCKEDFLNRPPEDRLAVDNFYKSYADLRLATAPLYNIVWFDFHNRAIMPMGESRAGNLLAPYNSEPWYMFTLSSLDGSLFNAWTGFHNVIGQANIIMRSIGQNATGVTEAQKNAAIAEARFMRATAYLNLVRAWGPVIIIENNEDLLKNPIVRTNRVEDVYKFVINDLTFASRNLPATDEPGRVTQWAAKGLLAKAYLSRSGYNNNGTRSQADLDSAKHYAGDVIQNSGLTLLENYPDLFKYQFRNNRESLFSLQWVPNGGWLVGNTLVSDLAYSSAVLGGSANGWSSTYASYDMLRAYEKGDTVRRNASWMTSKSFYPEINKATGGFRYPATDTTRAPIKKYVPGGTADNDGAIVATQSSPLTTYMLRLSDVYLTYTEAELGNAASLNGGDGLKYFNMVRTRARVQPKTAITFSDVMTERRVEFAMEFQYWYDLVSWWYFKPAEMLNFINNQERGATYTYRKDAANDLVLRVATRKANPVKATNENMRFPYPESEIVQNPLLKEAPVAYEFK